MEGQDGTYGCRRILGRVFEHHSKRVKEKNRAASGADPGNSPFALRGMENVEKGKKKVIYGNDACMLNVEREIRSRLESKGVGKSYD
jgi:hypothetical protein